MHVAKLTTMAFVKNYDDALVINIMLLIFLNKGCQLLDCGNNNMRLSIRQLPLQDCCRRIAVRSPFLKAIVFLHRLIVQILTVNNKEHFIDVWQQRCYSCCLKRCERLSRARRMPDITTGSDISILPVIMSYLNSVNNALCSCNLIRTHNHQHILRSKNTILRKNVKDCMLSKKSLCKVD